jgi:hypothetical protein
MSNSRAQSRQALNWLLNSVLSQLKSDVLEICRAVPTELSVFGNGLSKTGCYLTAVGVALVAGGTRLLTLLNQRNVVGELEGVAAGNGGSTDSSSCEDDGGRETHCGL